jgi:hypothetical protein
MRNHNNPTDPLSTVRGPLQYASLDPTINYVGFMALSATTAQVSNLELDGNTPTNPTWNVDSDGTWSNSSNWQNGVPNSAGTVANFGSVATSARTVTVDSNQNVGVLLFSSPTSYTIASSGGAINFTSGAARGGINVGAGAQEISAPLTQTGSIDIAVANGASLKLSTHSTLDVNSINTPGTAKLDITNNSMIIPYTTSPLTSIKAQIISGYAGGSWTGAGIDSSSAAADPNHSTGIGYADNNALLKYTTFAGQTVAAKSLLLRYTYYGDANLDGTVNALDFNELATNFGKAGVWTGGDFNYSGTVDSNDFSLLAANYGKTMPSMAPASAAALGSIVPEPTTLLLCGGIGVTLFGRRRQRHL